MTIIIISVTLIGLLLMVFGWIHYNNTVNNIDGTINEILELNSVSEHDKTLLINTVINNNISFSQLIFRTGVFFLLVGIVIMVVLMLIMKNNKMYANSFFVKLNWIQILNDVTKLKNKQQKDVDREWFAIIKQLISMEEPKKKR